MDSGQVQVSFQLRGAACLVRVGGELTAATEGEFTRRMGKALAQFPGPALLDLSGLDFVDGHGSRALARTLRADPPQSIGLYQCRPALRRVLEAFGLDLPQAPVTFPPVLVSPPPAAPAAAPAHAELLARVDHTRSALRQSALTASEVMSRLSATYAELALSGRNRQPSKAAVRGRLLACSGQAFDLSRQYRRQAAGESG